MARYGLVGSLWEVPAVNSALQCLAAAAPCKDVKIYPSCIFQVHAPMFVTIKTSLRCLNPHDLCLCLICVGAAILDIPLLCAPRDGAGARAAEEGHPRTQVDWLGTLLKYLAVTVTWFLRESHLEGKDPPSLSSESQPISSAASDSRGCHHHRERRWDHEAPRGAWPVDL